VEVGYWSTIEVAVGVICACMPAIRALFSKLYTKTFGPGGSSSDRSGYGYSSNSNRGLSKLSQKPKFGNTSSSAGTQIRVQHGWTVMNSGIGNQSDAELELVSVEKQRADSHTEVQANECTITPTKSFPDQWSGNSRLDI
jgi:hypothetical protein